MRSILRRLRKFVKPALFGSDSSTARILLDHFPPEHAGIERSNANTLYVTGKLRPGADLTNVAERIKSALVKNGSFGTILVEPDGRVHAVFGPCPPQHTITYMQEWLTRKPPAKT